MFAVDRFEAILNPPQGAIMAVGRGVDRARLGADGAVTSDATMTVTVSADARVGGRGGRRRVPRGVQGTDRSAGGEEMGAVKTREDGRDDESVVAPMRWDVTARDRAHLRVHHLRVHRRLDHRRSPFLSPPFYAHSPRLSFSICFSCSRPPRCAPPALLPLRQRAFEHDARPRRVVRLPLRAVHAVFVRVVTVGEHPHAISASNAKPRRVAFLVSDFAETRIFCLPTETMTESRAHNLPRSGSVWYAHATPPEGYRLSSAQSNRWPVRLQIQSLSLATAGVNGVGA